ncbi:MAG: Hydroxymethylglutaryl-CoA lyase [Mycobacterium sp.]|nr:Hydroxymethylglutaryl-CoA lyase [Mycobacterium sp.]
MSELPEHVTIREVPLRDGLQIEEPILLSARLELLAAVAAAVATALVGHDLPSALLRAGDRIGGG